MNRYLNAGVANSVADSMIELGGVPSDRIRSEPPIGKAKLEDLIEANQISGLFELVDGTLVEKAKGWRESVLAIYLIELIGSFVRDRDLGVVSGPDGFIRLLTSSVRGPDVAFFSWDRLPGGVVPSDSVPEIVPDLAIEVLSKGNTFAEMSRKRHEYFYAGVKQVWMVDPNERTVAVYTAMTEYTVLSEQQVLCGGDLLAGLEISLEKLFGELDRQRPAQ